MPAAAERLAHAEPGRSLGRAVADVVAVPVAPEVGLERHLAEAVHGVGQPALEREAAHLAVGHDLDPRLLLEAHRRVDGPILCHLQLGRRRLTAVEPLPDLEQLGRPQQAPHHIGVGRDHGCECSQALRRGMLAL